MNTLEFIVDDDPDQAITAVIEDLVIAGWTGRDAASVEHHIAELAAIGVARPRAVPCFYRAGVNLLTTDEIIDVTGPDSSGEVEFILLSLPEGLFIGLGSDHTDRRVEAYGVTVSKQVCPKPIAPKLWRYETVQPHWDSLQLSSWINRSGITRSGERQLYQQGAVSRMLAPLDLIARYTGAAASLPVGTAMFCGTLPLQAQMGFADLFELEIEDPILGRKIQHRYRTRELPYQD